MWEQLLQFSLASAALAISPGPDNMYVLTQSISRGASYGIATTAGLISGCVVHTTLVAFGVSAILLASAPLFWAIKIAGAAYLFFLAFQVYKSPTDIQLAASKSVFTHGQLFRQGVLMNILNPKVTLFFMAFFPAFLWDKAEDTVLQFYILGLVFMTVSFMVFSTIALLSGKVAGLLRGNKQTGLYLKWLQILVFIGIALLLLLP